MIQAALPLFELPCWLPPSDVASILAEYHYLGPIRRGQAWLDRFGVIVVTPPTARHVPQHWLELARWCIVSRERNGGSQQWAAMIRSLRANRPDVTTIVSYSDPSVGHTGALYRACNWLWAPTWHRLRPPPTGNGTWGTGIAKAVKDRWIYPVRPDAARVTALTIDDGGVLRRYPWAVYQEPRGVPFKKWQQTVLEAAE